MPPSEGREALTTISLVNTCTAGNLFNRWWIKRQRDKWLVKRASFSVHGWEGYNNSFFFLLINNRPKRVYPNSLFIYPTVSCVICRETLYYGSWRNVKPDAGICEKTPSLWILPKNENSSFVARAMRFLCPVSAPDIHDPRESKKGRLAGKIIVIHGRNGRSVCLEVAVFFLRFRSERWSRRCDRV